MAQPIGFDPSVINQATVGNFYPGEEREYAGRRFRFYKLTDAVAGVSGMVCEAASATDGNIVTVDRAGGSALGRIPRGVLVGNVTAGNYFFALVDGLHAGVKDAANALTPVGKKVTTHATTDGDAAPSTAYTDIWVGEVRVVGAAGVAAVYVHL